MEVSKLNSRLLWWWWLEAEQLTGVSLVARHSLECILVYTYSNSARKFSGFEPRDSILLLSRSLIWGRRANQVDTQGRVSCFAVDEARLIWLICIAVCLTVAVAAILLDHSSVCVFTWLAAAAYMQVNTNQFVARSNLAASASATKPAKFGAHKAAILTC